MPDTSKQVTDVKINGESWGVFFHSAGEAVFSAEKIQRMVAWFEGPVVDGGSSLLTWKTLDWTSTSPSDTRTYLYVRHSSSETGIRTSSWEGPYLNDSKDISSISDRYIQLSLVMYSDGNATTETMNSPALDSISLSNYVTSAAQKFYTKSFYAGFKPRHVLLTYNGTIPEGALVQFAVAGSDSSKELDYQTITVGEITSLDDISDLSDEVKVMIRATGSTEIPFVIDEFALALSGEEDKIML